VSGPLRRRALAGAAVLGGALAPFAGSPYRVRHARIDVERLAGVVAREEDHVTALELAQWIKDRRPGLRVLDLGSVAAFDEYHVPTAEPTTLEALAAAPYPKDDTLVLYSADGAHAAQGGVLLRALGYEHVYFLRGGPAAWMAEVMNLTLPAGASADESVAFRSTAEISRYFGGVPRVAPAGAGTTGRGAARTTPAAAAARAMRRRGC